MLAIPARRWPISPSWRRHLGVKAEQLRVNIPACTYRPPPSPLPARIKKEWAGLALCSLPGLASVRPSFFLGAARCPERGPLVGPPPPRRPNWGPRPTKRRALSIACTPGPPIPQSFAAWDSRRRRRRRHHRRPSCSSWKTSSTCPSSTKTPSCPCPSSTSCRRRRRRRRPKGRWGVEEEAWRGTP